MSKVANAAHSKSLRPDGCEAVAKRVYFHPVRPVLWVDYVLVAGPSRRKSVNGLYQPVAEGAAVAPRHARRRRVPVRGLTNRRPLDEIVRELIARHGDLFGSMGQEMIKVVIQRLERVNKTPAIARRLGIERGSASPSREVSRSPSPDRLASVPPFEKITLAVNNVLSTEPLKVPSGASQGATNAAKHHSDLDMNKLSLEDAAAVKRRMDVEFERLRVRPGDPDFVYDKRVDFEGGSKLSDNDWDEDATEASSYRDKTGAAPSQDRTAKVLEPSNLPSAADKDTFQGNEATPRETVVPNVSMTPSLTTPLPLRNIPSPTLSDMDIEELLSSPGGSERVATIPTAKGLGIGLDSSSGAETAKVETPPTAPALRPSPAPALSVLTKSEGAPHLDTPPVLSPLTLAAGSVGKVNALRDRTASASHISETLPSATDQDIEEDVTEHDLASSESIPPPPPPPALLHKPTTSTLGSDKKVESEEIDEEDGIDEDTGLDMSHGASSSESLGLLALGNASGPRPLAGASTDPGALSGLVIPGSPAAGAARPITPDKDAPPSSAAYSADFDVDAGHTVDDLSVAGDDDDDDDVERINLGLGKLNLDAARPAASSSAAPAAAAGTNLFSGIAPAAAQSALPPLQARAHSSGATPSLAKAPAKDDDIVVDDDVLSFGAGNTASDISEHLEIEHGGYEDDDISEDLPFGK